MENASEFLDYRLKPVIQKWKSYIKDSGDFINKIKKLKNIPDGTILVTADVVGLYPSTPYEAGLRALNEALENRESKTIPAEKLFKMAKFVLKNNYFDFNEKFNQQVSDTAIGTKFAPTYTWIFMGRLESQFLKSQEFGVATFVWTHREEKLESFLDELDKHHSFTF